jgi:hypothetical protein
MDQPNKSYKPRSLFFPLLLVVVGVFLLLVNLDFVEGSVWSILATYWPLIFVIGGLDGLYRRDGWVGPLVSLGLGVILMLGNLGYIQWKGFDLLLRLWPILLVAWGLDVAFSHRSTLWSTLLRVGLGLLLVVGIIWLAVVSPFGTGNKVETFSQDIQGETSSSLEFTNGAGEFFLDGTAAQYKLVDGTAGIPQNLTLLPSYTNSQDGTSTYSLESNGVTIYPFDTTHLKWDFSINPSIAVDLKTRMGVGNMVLDLSGTKAENVDAGMGVGQVVITFPAQQDVTGSIKNAIGETVLRVPQDTRVIVHYSGGLTSVDLPQGFSRSGDEISSDFSAEYTIEIDVDQAIGSLDIERY